MVKNVLVINGSTPINGNTSILVNKIIKGSMNTGVNIKLIELKKKKITDCIGGYQCLKESKCSFQDDMTEIRKEYEKEYGSSLVI